MTDQEIKESILRKLNPARFSGMSGQMAAIVGCILGQGYTDPSFAEFHISSDGFILARRTDDIGFNEFLGSYAEFEDNWTRLLKAAGVTVEEGIELASCLARVTTDERP